MTTLPLVRNDHGTPVSVLTCATCGRTVTICPALGGDWRDTWGTDCLADDCPSYDLARDIDTFFEPMAEAGLVRRTP